MVKKEIINKIKRFKSLLKKEGVPVSKVFLYGSYARGTAHQDSDIDVCVVSPVFGKDRMKERFFLSHQAPKVDVRIEAVPFSLEAYHKNRVSPLLHQVRKEGLEIK